MMLLLKKIGTKTRYPTDFALNPPARIMMIVQEEAEKSVEPGRPKACLKRTRSNTTTGASALAPSGLPEVFIMMN